MPFYRENDTCRWIQAESGQGKQAGFHMTWAMFALSPAMGHTWFEEPALIIGARIWLHTVAGWERFNAFYESNPADFTGPNGEDWDEVQAQGIDTLEWTRDFDIIDPPAGVDGNVRMKFGTDIKPQVYFTPYRDGVDNFGLEFGVIAYREFRDALRYVEVTKTDLSVNRYTRTQVKDIVVSDPDAIAKIGFVVHEDVDPCWIIDMTAFGWDTLEIETLQKSYFGSPPLWTLRIGGTNLASPTALPRDVEARLI